MGTIITISMVCGVLWVAEQLVHLPKKLADARQAKAIMDRMTNRKRLLRQAKITYALDNAEAGMVRAQQQRKVNTLISKLTTG